MQILFVGDVVGDLGMKMVNQYLPLLKKDLKPQLTIVNGENSTKVGRGINERLFKQIMKDGADVVTLGNHAWNNPDIFNFIDDTKKLIRPLNYPGKQVPGEGFVELNINGVKAAVINLQGRIFMEETDDPFAKIDECLEQLKKDKVTIIFVDMHAETTSEKKAMAMYLDGRVSAVVGTHTHVQTNDGHVLRKGTAFLTDAGMTGPDEGVIGMQYEPVIHKFLTSRPSRFEVEENGDAILSGCLIDVDKKTGLAKKIKTIMISKDHPYHN
ncbi:TIGR00282 family metallophosphoesterase [Fructilactobacillus sp. Tb1]|uniref:TIGR00282 family metallophosphoesterase n=1 Tax=Fructilactobacillus sp. Tb1 TaxID=3422304 RepID=UPI003D2E0E18